MKKNLAFLLAMIFALTAVLGVMPAASAEEAETVAPSTEIAYFNLSLRVGATLLFAVPSEGYTVNPDGTVDNLKLLVSKDSTPAGLGGVSDGEFLEASGKYMIGDKEYIIFEYVGLAANEMTDIVYARTAILEDNGFYTYGEAESYSVTEFLQQYEAEDARITKLIGSMLSYGDAALEYEAKDGIKANYLPSESDSELYTIRIKRVVDGVAIDSDYEINQFAKAGEVTLSIPPVYGASATSFEGATVTDGKVTVSGNLDIIVNYASSEAVVDYSYVTPETDSGNKGHGGNSGTVTGSFILGDVWEYGYANFKVESVDGAKCIRFAHNGAGQQTFGTGKVGGSGVFTGKGYGDTVDFTIQIKVKAAADGSFPTTTFRIDRTGDLSGAVGNAGGTAEILKLEENGDIVLRDLDGKDVVLGKGDATKFQTITVVCDASEHKYIGYIDGDYKGETTMNMNAPYLYASLAAGKNTRFQVCMFGGFQASNWKTIGFPADLVGEGKAFTFTEKEGGDFVIDKDTGLYRNVDVNNPDDVAAYADATRYAISYDATTIQSVVSEYVEAHNYFYYSSFELYAGNIMSK